MKKFYQDILKYNIKVINLDVTAQEYYEYKNDKNIPLFIVYDKTLKDEKLRAQEKYSSLASLMLYDELTDDIQFYNYGKNLICDNFEDVTKYNIWSVAVALNTYGKIHSKKNYTYMKYIDKYFNFLSNFMCLQ